jgi:hypothetical protein
VFDRTIHAVTPSLALYSSQSTVRLPLPSAGCQRCALYVKYEGRDQVFIADQIAQIAKCYGHPLFSSLPQVAEINTPQSMDAAGECFL